MKAMKAMKGMKGMKSMQASSTNAKNKTMKATKGKAMDKAKVAMGQWAIRCQKPGCTSWVWLWKPCCYQWRCQSCKRPWASSLPNGLHERKATKAGSKAK
jgi:hypothetical protein